MTLEQKIKHIKALHGTIDAMDTPAGKEDARREYVEALARDGADIVNALDKVLSAPSQLENCYLRVRSEGETLFFFPLSTPGPGIVNLDGYTIVPNEIVTDEMRESWARQ